MEKNFTPLNIDALYPQKQPENNGGSLPNTIFLLLVTITVLVIVIVLFVIIQKSLRGPTSRIPVLPVLSHTPVFHG